MFKRWGKVINATLGSNPNKFFNGPWALSIDEDNNIYIGDTQNHAIRMIDSKKNIINTIANANMYKNYFEKICSMEYYNGKLYIPNWQIDDPDILIILSKS
ncbi:MAG TPA: hypothetical protein DCM73_16725 [Clostridiales bacterium]|nr:hypothetical protein [Lachnospiraceae bacterium]HAQ42297.1 hypothetical protein [Clostridiales bacterium]